MRLVRQAKAYVARHEGALQERYAQSRNTRDLWARFKLLMAAVSDEEATVIMFSN